MASPPVEQEEARGKATRALSTGQWAGPRWPWRPRVRLPAGPPFAPGRAPASAHLSSLVSLLARQQRMACRGCSGERMCRGVFFLAGATGWCLGQLRVVSVLRFELNWGVDPILGWRTGAMSHHQAPPGPVNVIHAAHLSKAAKTCEETVLLTWQRPSPPQLSAWGCASGCYGDCHPGCAADGSALAVRANLL